MTVIKENYSYIGYVKTKGKFCLNLQLYNQQRSWIDTLTLPGLWELCTKGEKILSITGVNSEDTNFRLKLYKIKL